MGDLFQQQKEQEILLKLAKIKKILEKVDDLKTEIETIDEIEEVETNSEPLDSDETSNYLVLTSPKDHNDAFEKEVMKELTRNKKELIKQKIIEYTSHDRFTQKDVKRLIVDKHKYCSKATFYRYLDELKKEEKLQQIEINNRRYLAPS